MLWNKKEREGGEALKRYVCNTCTQEREYGHAGHAEARKCKSGASRARVWFVRCDGGVYKLALRPATGRGRRHRMRGDHRLREVDEGGCTAEAAPISSSRSRQDVNTTDMLAVCHHDSRRIGTDSL
jgi:hypothetical protein